MQRDGSTLEAAEARFLETRQPSRRFVDDANVAGLIAFLCGPHGADINGAAMPIDGGWTAGR
jgi:3-hydroxybutyrate dehydrogenase